LEQVVEDRKQAGENPLVLVVDRTEAMYDRCHLISVPLFPIGINTQFTAHHVPISQQVLEETIEPSKSMLLWRAVPKYLLLDWDKKSWSKDSTNEL